MADFCLDLNAPVSYMSSVFETLKQGRYLTNLKTITSCISNALSVFGARHNMFD